MKINSSLLADVLSGRVGDYSSGRNLLNEIKGDARLVQALWYLEHLSRDHNKLQEAVNSVWVGGDDEEDDCGPNHELDLTLRYLSGDEIQFAGRIPAQIRTGLYKLMAQHAEAAKATLADTKVSKLIFKELDLAMRHKVPVPIIGDSRFGKTKAVSVWCEMRPGLARVVTVPDSNREWDFFAAHADAFGIEYSARTTLQRLKRAVQWVVEHSGLFICYDEAHYLFPVNYSLGTAPKRINWVRHHVIDKGIGCAFFATPQSLNQTLEQYVAKTKYNMAQWLGRLAPPVILADCYNRAELMAVAKVHFPEFPAPLLALVCARSMQSETYLKGMELAARYASALALDRRHRTPTEQDVAEAIERMMPSKAEPHPTDAPDRAVSSPLKDHLISSSSRILDGESEEETPTNFARNGQRQMSAISRAMSPQASIELATV